MFTIIASGVKCNQSALSLFTSKEGNMRCLISELLSKEKLEKQSQVEHALTVGNAVAAADDAVATRKDPFDRVADINVQHSAALDRGKDGDRGMQGRQIQGSGNR